MGDLYLKINVWVLADVFENFINTYLEHYGLDPVHYFITQGLRWDAMLKLTEIELELILGTDIYLFIEKEKTGGISYIAKRLLWQIKNTWNVIMHINQVNISRIWMQTICMVRQWVNIYLIVNLNG